MNTEVIRAGGSCCGTERRGLMPRWSFTGGCRRGKPLSTIITFVSTTGISLIQGWGYGQRAKLIHKPGAWHLSLSPAPWPSLPWFSAPLPFLGLLSTQPPAHQIYLSPEFCFVLGYNLLWTCVSGLQGTNMYLWHPFEIMFSPCRPHSKRIYCAQWSCLLWRPTVLLSCIVCKSHVI